MSMMIEAKKVNAIKSKSPKHYQKKSEKAESAPSAGMNIKPMVDAPRTVNSVQNVRPTITLHPSARQENQDKKRRNLQERNTRCIKSKTNPAVMMTICLWTQ
ncbi:hypothetical protein DPMN_193439 [Dreissena polymorpha]|uniref:Uncharacterized protein n=1 Tax=Dreissena polymorpha TaxID=45954 RepID=A0A9D3Y1B7_DREPO|nr:hypothetical protein DPMN_193439 [Dreissena polymorpha]